MQHYTVVFNDMGNCDIAEYEVDAPGYVEALDAAYEQFIDDFVPEEVGTVVVRVWHEEE